MPGTATVIYNVRYCHSHMQCPVLPQSYTMPGTATVIYNARYCHSHIQCPVLTQAYADTQSLPVPRHGARAVLACSPRGTTLPIVRRLPYDISGTDCAHALCGACICYYQAGEVVVADAPIDTQCAIPLCACYAMPGTDLANDAIGLRACYAVSRTEIAYALLDTSSLSTG
eukprot:270407-Rhodomonas_salina.2